MFKTNKLIFLISFFFLVLFFSCNKETSINTQNNYQVDDYELNVLVSQVKNWHDSVTNHNTSGNSENYIKSQSISPDDIKPPVIDWDLAFNNYDSSNVKSITIPIEYNLSTGELLQLVATSKNGSINGYLIKQIPDSAYYAVHPDIIDLNGYTGKYIIYDLTGRCLLKLNFKGGSISSNSSSSKENITIKSNGVSTPCSTCDLPTVTVTSYSRFLDDFNNVGAFGIASSTDLISGLVVIAGGGSIYNSSLLSFISIPNGECVFGSLAYIGNKFGLELDVNRFIQQWADIKGLTLNEMKYKLDNVQEFRPGFRDAIGLLNKNFITTPLKSYDAVLKSAKEGRPIYVLIDWKDGYNNGHCVVLEWDNKENTLMVYDSVDNSKRTIKYGDDIYSKIKYFYSVLDINYDGF